MPLKRPPCIVPGCYNRTVGETGRCQEHKPAAYQSRRKERLPDDWQQRRTLVFKRDSKMCPIHNRIEAFCYLCGACQADTIDHKIQGDDHSLDNLAAVHDRQAPHCHRYKTAQEGINAREGRRPAEYGSQLTEQYREYLKRNQ